MKILFTIGTFGPGGKERRMSSLMEILAERGFELGIIAQGGSPNLARVSPLCRRTYEYRPGQRRFNIREHRQAVADFGPDLIHSWNGANTLYSLLAARGRSGCRVVTSEITNARYAPLLSKEYWMTRLNFSLSDRVLSNSMAGLEAKVAPLRKSRVIYNGYRLDRLERIDLEKYRNVAAPGNVNVVMAARFSREKDYSTVLKTAALARGENLKLHFVLAGDGCGLPAMRAEAERLRLDNVTFTGHVADIDNLLCQMDVGILSTNARYHQEGISNSVIEYMAHGMPAVVSRGGATREIIRSGWNGYVFRESDPLDLLDRLGGFATDRELAKRLGNNARRTVIDRFNIDDMGERFIRLYRELLRFS